MRFTLKQIRRAIFILAFLILAGGIGFWFGQNQGVLKKENSGKGLNRQAPPDRQEVGFDLFWDVWDRIEASFIDKDKIDPAEMIYGAIAGMVASLGDPYTAFLSPNENQRALEDLAGTFGGIGIQLGFIDHHLAVIAPLAGTPAQRAGVEAGDLILKIDDLETEEIALPQAVDMIRGEKGTPVVLTVLGQDEVEPREIEIVRDMIVVKSVEVEFLRDWCQGLANQCPLVAHLKLIRFGDRTNNEWKEAVEEIVKWCPENKNQCLGVILDLRNNPGGYLTGSAFVASEFLDSGLVVYQETAQGDRQNFEVNRQGMLLEVPLVVLVNKGSASASEIVAGCLKERQRARIVGEMTFGKGSIQEAQDLKGGAGLHITTARWLLPSGQSIDEQGLRPDFEVKNDLDRPDKDLQLEKAIEILAQ